MALLTTNLPDLFFEDTPVGRKFKELWEADDAAIDAVLADYGVPSPCEWTKPGSYLQTTIRNQVEKERRQNDVVLIPVGCTENHGRQTVSSMDTLFVSHLCEAVRRHSKKHHGHAPAIALPPLMYGGHPYHHLGMPGTVMLRESVVEETLVDVMLGLWNDGWRKQIIVNNHGQLWMLETAMHKFLKRYQLPGIFRVIDWHRSVKDFFRTTDQGGWWDTPFIHADEAETSVGLLLFPEMVDMEQAVETETKQFLPSGPLQQLGRRVPPPAALERGRGPLRDRVLRHPRGRRRQADPRRRVEGQAAGGGVLRVPHADRR